MHGLHGLVVYINSENILTQLLVCFVRSLTTANPLSVVGLFRGILFEMFELNVISLPLHRVPVCIGANCSHPFLLMVELSNGNDGDFMLCW